MGNRIQNYDADLFFYQIAPEMTHSDPRCML